MELSFRAIHIIILIIVGLILGLIVLFFHRRHFPLKVSIPLALVLFILIAVMLQPTIDFPILSHPKIPKEMKIKYVAASEMDKLGYDISEFEISIKRKDSNWLVEFVPINKDFLEKNIKIWIDNNLKVVSIEK